MPDLIVMSFIRVKPFRRWQAELLKVVTAQRAIGYVFRKKHTSSWGYLWPGEVPLSIFSDYISAGEALQLRTMEEGRERCTSTM
jgi:hypothetical protein